MDINGLLSIRGHVDKEIEKIRKDRETLLPPKQEEMSLVRSSQIEELLVQNTAILAELRYMNDRGEVNNG